MFLGLIFAYNRCFKKTKLVKTSCFWQKLFKNFPNNDSFFGKIFKKTKNYIRKLTQNQVIFGKFAKKYNFSHFDKFFSKKESLFEKLYILPKRVFWELENFVF